MITEALEYLRGRVLKSERKIFGDPSSDNYVVVFDPESGELKEHELKPAPIAADVNTIDDIWRWVQFAKSPYEGVQRPSVWVSIEKIVAYADTDRELCRCVMRFSLHHALKQLRDRSADWKTHADFLHFLRNDLFGVKFQPAGIIEATSTLKFEVSNSSHSELSNVGDASVSRNHLSKVSGAKELPQEVIVSFPIAPSVLPDFIVHISCGLFVDTANARIRITPRPGEIDRVCEELEHQLRNSLLASLECVPAVPVFLGTL